MGSDQVGLMSYGTCHTLPPVVFQDHPGPLRFVAQNPRIPATRIQRIYSRNGLCLFHPFVFFLFVFDALPLPTAQVTPALTNSFSRVHDPFAHASEARPLTTVGWTSLSVSCHVLTTLWPDFSWESVPVSTCNVTTCGTCMCLSSGCSILLAALHPQEAAWHWTHHQARALHARVHLFKSNSLHCNTTLPPTPAGETSNNRMSRTCIARKKWLELYPPSPTTTLVVYFSSLFRLYTPVCLISIAILPIHNLVLCFLNVSTPGTRSA